MLQRTREFERRRPYDGLVEELEECQKQDQKKVAFESCLLLFETSLKYENCSRQRRHGVGWLAFLVDRLLVVQICAMVVLKNLP